MSGARWDTLSGALNLCALILFAWIITGPKPSMAVSAAEMASPVPDTLPGCEVSNPLPQNVHAYRRYVDMCLTDMPRGVELREGDMLAMFYRLNKVRADHGLQPLQWHQGASDVARVQALDMMRRKYLGHSSPEGLRGVDRLHRLFRDEIFGNSGENLAWFRDAFPATYTDQTLARQLEGSPSHFETIINPDYTHVGLAIVQKDNEYMAVQVFISAEGNLLEEWPDQIFPGLTMDLPELMNGRSVQGWRLQSKSGKMLARGYGRRVVVPELDDDEPVRLIVMVELTQTNLLLLKGPAADVLIDAP